MARYHMDDGTVVDTKNATESWEEETRWDGNNNVSVATGTQWDHEKLHRSRKGRYWIEQWSQWQGRLPSARWVSHQIAAAWLLANEHEIPADLVDAAAEVAE